MTAPVVAVWMVLSWPGVSQLLTLSIIFWEETVNTPAGPEGVNLLDHFPVPRSRLPDRNHLTDQNPPCPAALTMAAPARAEDGESGTWPTARAP